MGTRDCFRPGHEAGLWYEIKTIEDTIRLKEVAGKDVTFEKELLASFRAYAAGSGYRSVMLDKGYAFNAAGRAAAQVIETTTTDLSPARNGLQAIMQHPGRPQKAPDEPVNRVTAWRRKKKELQGVLVSI